MTKVRRKRKAYIEGSFQPLEAITKPTVPTDHAAYLLNREPRTLRGWSSLENGPIRPIHIFGKLAWPVSEIRELLSGNQV